MALNYTVNDIVGVGFKYIQTAEDQLVPVATGTSLAVFGTATWGPVNKPYYFSGTGVGNVSARANFMNVFGSAGTIYDDGWDAAYYHFGYSSLGYFTRINSSSNPAKRSYKEVVTNSTLAILTGTNVLGNTLRVYPITAGGRTANNLFSFSVKHKYGANAIETVPINVNFSDTGAVSQGAFLERDFLASSTYTSNKTFSFDIIKEDGNTASFSFTSTNSGSVTSPSSFVSLITSSSGTNDIGGVNGNGVNFTVSSTSTSVKISTEPYHYGPTTKITITQNDFSNNFGFAVNSNDFGVDPFRSTLISAINTKFKNTQTGVVGGATFGTLYGANNVSDLTIATVNADGYLVLTSPGNGSNFALYILTANGNSLFGFSNGATNQGVDGLTIGTFRAKYRGTEGNLITVVFSNTSSTFDNLCEIFFKGSLIASIRGYNFNSNDLNNYLPYIIRDSSAIAEVLAYDHNKTFTVFNEDDDSLSIGTVIPGVTTSNPIGDGVYVLSGGTDGADSIDAGLDLIPQIKAMNNDDIYSFDIVAAPGYVEQSVQKALVEDVCEYRKDCFTVLDMPDFGNPSAAVDRAINWINGKHISRSEKLNSIYAAVYFPWVKLKKTTYNSDMSINTDLIDNSPVSRVLGMISRNDSLTNSIVRAPAGVQRGTLDDIEGLKQNLSAKEKDLLYGDVYDNCINPIMYSTTYSWFVNGQKTALRKNSRGNLTSLSRINVMRTGLYIKREISKIIPRFFHQPNDDVTRKDFVTSISLIMDFLIQARAIETDVLIKCDDNNNPAEVTNNNGLIAEIEFTPIKTVERIKVFTNIKERKTTITV